MPSIRVLFLGVTGINKKDCLSRLADWAERNRNRNVDVFDFEHDFLFDPNNGGV